MENEREVSRTSRLSIWYNNGERLDMSRGGTEAVKRRNQWILFVVLLLSLTILSPSLEISRDPVTDEDDQSTDPLYRPAPQVPQEQQPLKITVSMKEQEFAVFQRFAVEIGNRIGTGVEVHNMKETSESDEYEAIREGFMLGDSADITLLNNRHVRLFAMQGYLRPFIGNDLNGMAADPFPQVITVNEWNQYRWAVPLDIDPYIYAEARRDNASSPPLQSMSTDEDWMNRITAWSKTDDKPFFLDVEDPLAFASWLEFRGIIRQTEDLFNPDEQNEQMQSRLQELEMLLPYIETDFKNSASGHLNWISGIVKLSDMLPEYRGELTEYINNDVETQALTVTGRSFAISSRTGQMDLASEWIKAMTSPETAQDWFEETGNLPIYRSVYEELEMRDVTRAIPVQALEQSLEAAYRNDLLNGDLLNNAQPLITQFLRGDITAEVYYSRVQSLFSQQGEGEMPSESVQNPQP